MLGAALLVCLATTVIAYKLRIRRRRRVRDSWRGQGSKVIRQ